MNSTDEMWDGNMLSSNTLTRYRVCNAIVGLIDTYPRKADAFDGAIRWANRNGEPADVYDSLARRGAGELWTFRPNRHHPEDDIINLSKPPARRKP